MYILSHLSNILEESQDWQGIHIYCSQAVSYVLIKAFRQSSAVIIKLKSRSDMSMIAILGTHF